MSHSPPIPPGNQPPYPIAEPPHDRSRDTIPAAKPATSGTTDTIKSLAPTLIVGAAVAGAVAAAATAFVRLRAKPAPPKPAARKPRAPADRAKSARTPPAQKSPPAAAKKDAPKPRAKPAKSSEPAAAPPPARAKKSRGGTRDDTTVRGPRDASRVAMGEDYEVRYWTEKFGVDREALQRAVDSVGNGADAVREALSKS